MYREDSFLSELDDVIQGSNKDLINENANTDGISPMGMMSLIASITSKRYTEEKLLSKEAWEAYRNGYIHIHDLDFYTTGTTTCCQIPLAKILKNGFNTGHGHMREPKNIMSAMALTSIILQSNQNQQHGGQSIPMFDYDLSKYVRLTFEKKLSEVSELLEQFGETNYKEKAVQIAWDKTDQEVYQACEAFIHNSNSMHSRGGSQTPFISINLGTDTSNEGRMITKNILLATQAGLGDGETPIFPIIVFKVKEGVNFNPEDKNYDLYKLSLITTSKRLFPNYVFIDAPFNLKYYDGTPESEIATMGCRTRTIGNVNGKETPVGRGNLSFTSINLPLIALESKDVNQFYQKLNYYTDVAVQQLYDRYQYQAQKKVSNFKFLYGQGVWHNGEELDPEETLGKILKQGTLSVGFVGLAEALVALTGQHHGESEEAWKMGYNMIQFIRDKTDVASIKYQMNFTTLATPAESFAGKALRITKKRHGVIKGVTDRDYFTNGFHIPVYYKISAFDKIKKEAPFHELTNAGHITYIELDGDASKNIEALDMIVRTMKENGIGYGSINHPVDRCMKCKYKGIIHNACPKCQNDDEKKIERIRRITGYLVGTMDKWNSAKRAEESDRVKHS
ncbi:anaerobic ribonucleoside triphosphate reductase [Paenibacillus polymyxa]|uniref:Ribonucleoside-triphosphate reductase n=1 Tax=Paenibacillus polymyxa (strain SC2) TaxID=886882 RepID=E3EK02_PAEPS|nr:anaerobic ribonucleoside triphosphate reductase [Paenibacillus polymyxa]ADO60021.1 ribonucleoside-triphosphate reductase [Paenibacillus polymyxa SC2]WPQ59762.1 anaerobic ribonucleoside triphosphate reductase [Paenibacillus polymyxa]